MKRPTVRGPLGDGRRQAGSAPSRLRHRRRRPRARVGCRLDRSPARRRLRRSRPERRHRLSGSGIASARAFGRVAAGSSARGRGCPIGGGSSRTGSRRAPRPDGAPAARSGLGVTTRRRIVRLGASSSVMATALLRSGGPVGGWSAVVLELERDGQVELAQAGDDALEVVLALAGDTNGVTLDL